MNPSDDRKKTRARVRPPATPPTADSSPEYPVGHMANPPTTPAMDVSPEYPVGHVPDYPTAPRAGGSAGHPAGYAADYPAATAGYATPPLPAEARQYVVDTPAPVAPGTHAKLGMDLDAEQTLELREEQLVARKDLRQVGEVRVRTIVEEVPGRLEVEALREEVEIEHVPMGQTVSERTGPWEEDDVLVVPVYEEQLVVVKRLVLKEHLKIRRVSSRQRQLFEDRLRRDRLVVEDPSNTHLVHETYPGHDDDANPDQERDDAKPQEEGGLLGQLVRKALG